MKHRNCTVHKLDLWNIKVVVEIHIGLGTARSLILKTIVNLITIMLKYKFYIYIVDVNRGN